MLAVKNMEEMNSKTFVGLPLSSQLNKYSEHEFKGVVSNLNQCGDHVRNKKSPPGPHKQEKIVLR